MSVSERVFAPIEEAIEEIRQGRMVVVCDDETRENEGDLVLAAAVRHSRGHQLHGQGGARDDLPRADRRALRRAGAGPHGGQERGPAQDRLHADDRRPRRRHHRHLRRRPGSHDPGRDRARDGRPGPRPRRAPAAAEGQAGRRARARRPHRGVGRPRAARRPVPGRRHLRGHERRRDDGPCRRPRRVLAPARAQDGHGRRPDRLPAPARQARRARGRDRAADQVRRVPRRRLPLARRRQAPRRDGQGRRRRRARRPRARPLASASPATCSTRCAATAASSSSRRWR